MTRTWPRHMHVPAGLFSGPSVVEVRVGRRKESTELSTLLHPASPMHLLVEIPACEMKLFLSKNLLSPFTVIES